MKTLKQLLLLNGFIVLSVTSWSQVSVGDIDPGKVGTSAFTLSQPEKIKIQGMGGTFYEDWQMLVYYGWIIDSETRKVVWHMADKLDDRDFDSGEHEINDEVSLGKGTYELYFAGSFNNRNGNWNRDGDWSFGSINGLVNMVFGDRDKVKFKYSMQEGLGIKVSGQYLTKVSSAGVVANKVQDAIVSIIKPDNNANEKKGFSLSGETTLRIYAIGEGRKNETFDYAWISNADTRKRVWVMDYGNTDFAGGADKNIVVKENITLPAGNYLVTYVTDDSHSYNDWNSLPPDDPQFAGITIWANSEKDKKNVIPFKMPEELKPVVQLTKVQEDEFVSQGFSVKSPLEFRLLCIGEESSDEMADNGWIMNAVTRQVVWDMNEQRKEHAGGASKNKMFDGTIQLPKGDYIAYYSTDDSHSYGDWNSGPPSEQEYYGITLWTLKKEDLSKVTLFEPGQYKSDKVLVEIVRVRDDENLSESFTLDKDTQLRVIAVGEGVEGEMVDYGWIKNTDTGKVVWEMTYRNTESAGGAKKNRLYNDTVILPKGSYKVYYETDGSHSYRHWNATPPREPEMYGISLIKEIN